MFKFFRKKDIQPKDYSTFFTIGEINAINTLIRDVASNLDLDFVLQKSIDSAVNLLNLHGGILFLKDLRGEYIYTKSMARSAYSQQALKLLKVDDMMDKLRVPIDTIENLVVDTVIHNRNNVSNELWRFTTGVTGLNKNLVGIIQKATMTGNVIVVPISHRDNTIGALLLSKRGHHESFDKDMPIIRIYANQIAIAISNAGFFAEKVQQIKLLEQQNKDLQSLYNLTSNINKSLDPDIVSQTAVDSLPQDDSMVGAVLGRYDENNNDIFIQSITRNQISDNVEKLVGGFSKYRISLEDDALKDNLSYKAFKYGTVYSSTDLGDFISPPIPRKMVSPISKILNIKSIVCFPVETRGNIIGTITYLLRSKTFEELTENEKQLYSTYTHQIAIALDNATLLKTVEKAKAEVEEAYKKEKDMMDILGHELRTPLAIARNAILMIDMELKKASPNMESVYDLLEKAKENIRREVKLLQSVLSSTRVENERAQFHWEKVDVKDVIHDSMDALGVEAKKKGLEINIIEPGSEVFAWAGREHSQEISDNLISNAIKYTHKGKVTITISEEDQYIKVSIKDTGEGIPDGEIKNLGKKFYRINPYVESSSTKDMKIVRPGGTGIGLYVVKNLLEVMDGRLEIKSVLGEGSEFSFYLKRYSGQENLNKEGVGK